VRTDCCQIVGVVCEPPPPGLVGEKYDYITEINWPFKNLKGVIPSGFENLVDLKKL